MKFEYDPKTKTYSARIVIGAKEPLSPDDMRKAFRKSVLGVTGLLMKKLEKKRAKELTGILFWVEEGWL